MSQIPDVPHDAGLTVQDYAYARLRNAILLGALPPGTALTFRGLAEALSLSPTPIREAVRRLHSEQAIDVLGNRRLQVPQMDAARFEELVRLRLTLEGHAAERAFPWLSDVVIDELTATDLAMDSAVARGDLDALTQLNQAFHKRLYGLNPNQPALPMIESIWLQLGPFQRQVLNSYDVTIAKDHHKEMLAAMRARDLTVMRRALEDDIRDGSMDAGLRLLRG
ncbi:GntR family transcriptional regulator [Pseudooceanicola sp. CBS1P-1]|uniref:FCD domain-containing protein n=1 Tax=Pseudooceanicola albus TaxID=2692189 RepID=A0A6L7G312_9RHOB|nr:MULTISPECIES: GntR family transcriptional regulator [Pseudooceanicola]MBT9382432.1 GntR family transcriptional regulator [Pseudooceanicola endophyticus]MXN16973.1 FCD domain-containing protein [Pseudooceanicola albus]